MDRSIAAIRRAYPDLDIVTARLFSGGQNADVLLVNEQAVFRFPRYAAEVPALARERAVLQGIHGRLPLATP